jgi:hypothetical protein
MSIVTEHRLKQLARRVAALEKDNRLSHEPEKLKDNAEFTRELGAEVRRLRMLFDEAGQGEHNVLALVEHYQGLALEAADRIRAARTVLQENGCECECGCGTDGHNDDCEPCLGCRVGEALS